MKRQFKFIMFLLFGALAFTACQENDPEVVACFSYTPEQGIKIGDTVYFSNCSQDAFEYAWNFGDSETSTETAPYHIFNQAGTFTVTLVASNGGIFETVSQEINVAREVVACFTISPEEAIHVGDTIYFTNCSEEATDFTWSFGDTETSAEVEPFHIYAQPGTYEVSLVASKNDDSQTLTKTINVTASYSYVINYGSYSGDKSTITAYNNYTGEVENGYYKLVNGVDLTSNIQHACIYKGNIYMMGNNSDGITIVNSETFLQTSNTITTGIVKPRYSVGNGNYLYVSCWGGDIWADENLSYIAKVNLTSKTVEKTIALPGGPEGLAIAKGKLYAALNYKDSVAVIDLESEGISYIETPAVTSYFVTDNNDNLYVTLISTYSDYSDSEGIGYINTGSDELQNVYKLPGVSTSYVNILSPNSDFTKLYVMTSAYDANWNLSGAVSVFDVASESFSTNNLVEGISGLNGVAYHNNKVITFVSETSTGNGKMVLYGEEGAELNEYTTGISPFMLLTGE